MESPRFTVVILVVGLLAMIAFHTDMDWRDYTELHDDDIQTTAPRIQTKTLNGETFDLAKRVGNDKYIIFYPSGIPTNLLDLQEQTDNFKKMLRDIDEYNKYQLVGILPYHEGWSNLLQNYPDVLPDNVTWIRDSVDLNQLGGEITPESSNNHLSIWTTLNQVDGTYITHPDFHSTFVMVVRENGEARIFQHFSWYDRSLKAHLQHLKNESVEPITSKEYLRKLGGKQP